MSVPLRVPRGRSSNSRVSFGRSVRAVGIWPRNVYAEASRNTCTSMKRDGRVLRGDARERIRSGLPLSWRSEDRGNVSLGKKWTSRQGSTVPGALGFRTIHHARCRSDASQDTWRGTLTSASPLPSRIINACARVIDSAETVHARAVWRKRRAK